MTQQFNQGQRVRLLAGASGVADGPTILPIMRSRNVKLGPIPATYTAAKTCPPACPLAGPGGCYAKSGLHTRLAWQRASTPGGKNVVEWDGFLLWVAQLPDGQVWRHNTGGDLPGQSDKLDRARCMEFARAASHTNPIVFTHYPVRSKDVRATGKRTGAIAAHNLATLRAMAGIGFTVNLSANAPEHAAQLRVAAPGMPVVSVADLPEGMPYRGTLPDGAPARACPATIKNSPVTCADCGLCASNLASKRKAVILFPAHGAGAKRARVIVRHISANA